jgi:hypothetical protein
MDGGGGQQVKGADSEWMNEHFAYTFFLSDFNNILSLSLFDGQTLIFCFRGGNASRFEYEDRDATQPKTKRLKTKRSSSSRLRESCVGRL